MSPNFLARFRKNRRKRRAEPHGSHQAQNSTKVAGAHTDSQSSSLEAPIAQPKTDHTKESDGAASATDSWSEHSSTARTSPLLIASTPTDGDRTPIQPASQITVSEKLLDSPASSVHPQGNHQNMAAVESFHSSAGLRPLHESSHYRTTSGSGWHMASNGVSGSTHVSWRSTGASKSSVQNASGSAKMAETVSLLKRRCAEELGAAMSNKIVSSHAKLIELIGHERLQRLPSEGSAWDKVLAWAQSFADKFNEFDQAIEEFTGGNYDGAEIAFGYCALLLALGYENAAALQTSFGFFFKCSLDLIALLDRVELFSASSEINEQLVLAYADLVTLVSDVALQFYQAIRDPSKSSVSINIYTVFAGTIESFRNRRDRIVDSMWKYQLAQHNVEASVSIKTLRDWLAIEDSVLKYSIGDHTSLVNDRQQLTCLWAQPYLSRFLNSGNDALAFTGPAGSGKSVLAGTVVDKLQRYTGKKAYSVLFVPINARVKCLATSLQVVRSLLSQLFENRVGDVRLYRALSEAFEASAKATNVTAYESLLWTALEKALASTSPQAKDTIMIVDGLDEVSDDPQDAQKLHKRLTASSSKHEKVKLITLSKPEAIASKTATDVQITPDLIYDDVFAVVSALLRGVHFLNQLSGVELDITVDQIVEASQSNFLWAKLVTKGLIKEGSTDQIRKTVATIRKAPKSLHEVIQDHVRTANLSDEGKKLLLWLTVSKRPLGPEELSLLNAVDPKAGTISGHQVDVLQSLKHVTDLVFLKDGLLSLRHAAIRQVLAIYFEQNKQHLPIREPSLDLTQRLLAYMKATIKTEKEPSFSTVFPAQADQLFNQHPLAEYAVRYWPSHYLEHLTINKETSPELKKDLSAILPTSPYTVVIERSARIWQPNFTQLLWFSTSLDLYRKVLNHNHPYILQLTIVLALIFQNIGDNHSAAKQLYSAVQLSTNIYSITHSLTTQCAKHFLDISSSLQTSTRTEIMTFREEVLIILIKSFTKQHGAVSEIVSQYQSQLIALYRSLKEESKAVELERSNQQNEKTLISDEAVKARTGSLGVRVVSRRDKEAEHKPWDWTTENDHDSSVQLEGSKRVDELLSQAQTYASKNLTSKAEQCYVEAWYHLTILSGTNRSSDFDARKIKIATTYAAFLKSNKREAEAAALLTGTWQEYQSSMTAQSEEVSSRLFEVGQTLKTMGFTATALEIFKHHASVMRSHQKKESSSYKEVSEYISTTQQELLKQISSSSSFATEASRDMLTEIISITESSKSTQLDITSTSAVKQVVTTKMAQKQWKEATTVIKQVLRMIWPNFCDFAIEEVGQPLGSPDLAYELAGQLITCYESRFRVLKAQDLRERLYHSLKLNRKIDDSLVKHNLSELLRMYERTRSSDKIIRLYQELLEDYKKAYGPAHPETLKILQKLAELTNPDPISFDYYRQVVELLTKDSGACHPDAIDALSIIANHYWNGRRYRDATWAYSLLFNAFVQKGKELKQFQAPAFVSTIYGRYVDSLKSVRTDDTTIYNVTKKYRETCISVFGAQTQITYEATLKLARVCKTSKRHEAEAITLYEQLASDSNASAYHTEAKATLNAIYEEKSFEASRSTNITASSEQVSRATTIVRQRLTENRKQYGWSHQESLEQLKEMSSLYAKQSKKEEAIKELTEATTQIVSQERNSASLVRSASAVASSYVAIGETQRGLEMAEELRWQLVTKDTSNSKKYNLGSATNDRSIAVYVAQLEHSLRQGTSKSFNETYLSVLTEIVYYEDFQRSIRSNASIEEVFTVAARLHSFLHLQKRSIMMVHVEDELVSFFLRTSGEKAKVGDVSQVKILVVTMLEYCRRHHIKIFLHSVNLACISEVKHLYSKGQHTRALELAQTAFRYCHAHGWYDNPKNIKQGIILAITVADLNNYNNTSHKSQIDVAAQIMTPLLQAAKKLDLNIASIPLEQISSIITILGEQKNYGTLELFLTSLWDARETHQGWRSAVVLAIGRRLVLTQFLLHKYDSAINLAADITYNLRRIYGSFHLAVLEMSILLGQLNISTGLALQSTKGAEELARRYYKRAVGVHEGVLRSLTLDPLGLNDDDDVTVLSSDPEPMDPSSFAHKDATPGSYARKHMIMLRLALERFGDYPKGYAEYEQLNADVFRTFASELAGLQGVEKWDIKNFGKGKAHSDEGALDINVKSWKLPKETSSYLVEEKHQVNGLNGIH